MPRLPADHTKDGGWNGNPDIYGIGIRIGYYTQAASIWVANFFAPHEAPYIHNVTLLFLVAILVGVCSLARYEDTHAVEPYILMTVAYNTLYMGLWDPRAPELLIWERHFKKRLTVDMIWICFHSFDIWYWWFGIWQLKPSTAPEGTLIYFSYVGQIDVFGWVSIPARTITAVALLWLWSDVILATLQQVQRRRVDGAIEPVKLLRLTSRWLKGIEHSYRLPRVIAPEDTLETPDVALPPGFGHSRNSSRLSIELNDADQSHSRPVSLISDKMTLEQRSTDQELTKEPFRTTLLEGGALPSYSRPARTGTGLLKRGLLRWPSNKEEAAFGSPPSSYTPYEPKFDDIYKAVELLKTCYQPPPGSKSRWQKISRCFLAPYICLHCIIFLPPALLTHHFHGSLLLAILSHGSNLDYSRKTSYPQAILRALHHPSYTVLKSQDILLASRILLTNNPPPKPGKWTLISLGWATFAACSVLVISVELTINWNAIKGVNNLNTVGQLIPFCLGVGGLGKVLWAATMEKDRRDSERVCYYGRCTSVSRRGEWKEVAEGWERCRVAFEREEIETLVEEG
ncbi:hypothetical protein E6O75_ATG08994 [Venturia nashicola]|uniref:Uncharacterized protein n=1 Tax=Venturia nashicola TaxID=86259 RepID=A0A4Z1NNX9_9PEZI|nr:hypothetical protein E6O75_ATG08994 [Venturia nashicola]